MNKLEIIEAVEELKSAKQYREALLTGIQNIDEDSAIEIRIKMVYEVLPIYEKVFPDKAPREALDLVVKYRKNPTELTRKNLVKAKDALAASAAYAAAAFTAEALAAAAAVSAAYAAANDKATAAAYAVKAAEYAYIYETAKYEKFCCKYIDKMLKILKRDEKA